MESIFLLALFIEMPKTDEGKTAQNSLMGYGLVIAKQFMPQTHLCVCNQSIVVVIITPLIANPTIGG